MFKKKLVALGVSAVAVTAVAGAGFAGWVFNEDATKDHTLGVNVTGVVSFGSITLATDIPDTVVLDQGVKDQKTGISLKKGSDVKTGFTATWSVLESTYNTVSSSLTYTVNVYIKGTTSSGLAKYVSGDSVTGTAVTKATVDYVKYSYTLSSSDINAVTNGNNKDVTMTLANPLVYIVGTSGTKPQSEDDYKQMILDIEAQDAANTVTAGNKDSVKPDTEYNVASTASPIIVEFVVAKSGS